MKKYTETQRLKHLRLQAQSGQTIKAYCAEHSVNIHSFKTWQKRYKDFVQDHSERSLRDSFVEVAVPRYVPGTGMIHIYLPNGIHLQMGRELDSRLIKLLSDV